MNPLGSTRDSVGTMFLRKKALTPKREVGTRPGTVCKAQSGPDTRPLARVEPHQRCINEQSSKHTVTRPDVQRLVAIECTRDASTIKVQSTRSTGQIAPPIHGRIASTTSLLLLISMHDSSPLSAPGGLASMLLVTLADVLCVWLATNRTGTVADSLNAVDNWSRVPINGTVDAEPRHGNIVTRDPAWQADCVETVEALILEHDAPKKEWEGRGILVARAERCELVSLKSL